MKYWKQNKSFKLFLDCASFRKGDIIAYGLGGHKIIVVKQYENTWWRKILVWLGIYQPILPGRIEYKVKPY
jgi:hypothetical protein